MAHVCVCLVGWKKPGQHICFLFCAKRPIEWKEKITNASHTQTHNAECSMIRQSRSDAVTERANNRTNERLMHTSINKIYTMTSLLNEKFLHIIGCVVCTRKAYISPYTRATAYYRDAERHTFHLVKESARGLFGLHNVLAHTFTENNTGFSLSLRVRLLVLSICVLFLCNRCSVLLIIAWHECVYYEAEHAVDVASSFFFLLFCLFICSCVYVLAFVFVSFIRLFHNI